MLKRILIFAVAALALYSVQAAEAERPKVGLVLGGGGALGFAHIGVIEVLEELQIPVDYIGGTSMGAIVAGMYASGMSPDEMKESLTALDWWVVMKDRSPHQYLVFNRKLENKRFMGAEIGFNHWSFQYTPGMSYGQKLNNVLETFALNSTGITDFDKMNIPYRAVATDLRKGESVAIKSGNLARAMRASMAVPGVFTPVYMDDRVFVDGGIMNNIPVDVVKEMGADIIIAVDVGRSAAEKSQQSDFNSLGDVVGRTYTIMQRPEQEEQLAKADIVIAPALEDYSSSHFFKVAEIIPCGKTAAEKMADTLSPLSTDKESYVQFLQKQRYKRDAVLTVDNIRIKGNDKVSSENIMYRVHSEPGPLNLDTINEDLLRIHGMGHFQTVTYNLEPTGEHYDLVYETQEKFWGPGFLRFGMKFETATDTSSLLWSLLLNYTRTQLNPYGGEAHMELEAGGHVRQFKAELYQPFVPSGRFFIAPSVHISDEDIDLLFDNEPGITADLQKVYGSLDLGASGFEFGEVRFGLTGGHAWNEAKSGIISLAEEDDSVVGLTTRFILDQLDDPVFPSHGYQFILDGFFAQESLGSSDSFNRLEGSLKLPFTKGRHTFLPKIAGGSSLGTSLPFYETFPLGGVDNFAGYAPYQFFGNYYGVASLGYRYRLGRLPPTLGNGIYAMGRIDAGNVWQTSSEVDINDLNVGGLAGIGADTIVGRFILAIGQAENINSPRIYLSIGNHF